MARGKGGWRKWMLAIVVVGGLTGWGLSMRVESAAKRSIAADKAALKALGVHVEPKDFATGVSEEQNAWTYYRLAIGKAPATSELNGARIAAEMTDISGLERTLAPFQGTLELVAKGAQREVCDFNRNWEKTNKPGFYTPKSGDYQRLLEPCLRQADLDCLRGRFQSAGRWLSVGARLAFHWEEPTLVGLMDRAMLEEEVLHCAATLLRRHGGRPKFRAALREFLDSLPAMPNFQKSFGAETIYILPMMEDASSMGSPSDPLGDRVRLMLLGPKWLNHAVAAKMYSAYREAVEACSSDPEAWQKNQKALADMKLRVAADTSFVGWYANKFTPAITAIGAYPTTMLARRRILDAELELLEQGPGAKGLPLDPFSKKPLPYRNLNGRLEPYSVGENLADDHGLPKDDVTLRHAP